MHSDDVDGAAKCGNTMTASEELLSVLRKEQQRIMELADEQHSAFERSLEAAFSRIQHLQQDLGANLSTGRRSVESIAASDLSLAQKDPEIANVRTVKPKMVDAFDPVPSPYGEFETWQRFVTPDLLPRDALCASHDSVEFEIPIGPKTSTKNMQSIPSSRSHPADGCDDRPPRSSSPTARGELAAERTDSKKLPIKSKTLERFLADTPGWAPAVKRVLDYAAGILVLVNSVVMLVELELEGRAIGRSVGYPEGRTDFGHPIGICRALNDSFSIIFFLELLVRMAIERRNFLNDLANWFDAVLAVAGLTDFFLTISLPDTSTSQSIVLLRLMRVMKSLRAIRMVRSLHIFRGLRLLVKACQCFLPSLCWSMVLLGVLMSIGALLMGNLLQEYIKDEELDFEDRQWLWERYGTAYRASYTLFEVTFAGNWPTRAERVLHVNQVFSVFFVFYVTVVVFAVLRVITAIFLKDTLDAAQNDAEQQVMDKMALRAKLIERLEAMFKVLDETGSGIITEERLQAILANPKAAAYFATLDLDVHEGKALFHLLDNGDGEVTQEEFISGILRCKGEARAIEQVAMHSELRILDRKVTKLIHFVLRSEGSSRDKRNIHKHLQVFRAGLDHSMSLRAASLEGRASRDL